MEREELLRLFISLDFVTINPVVIIGYTIIILGEFTMKCCFDTCDAAIDYATQTKAFGYFYSESKNQNQEIHVHECCEVFLCITGGSSFLINDKVYNIHDGDLFLINQFETHKVVPDNRDLFCRHILHVHPSFLYTNAFGDISLSECFYSSKKITQIHLSTDEVNKLTVLFESLRTDYGYGDDMYKKLRALELLLEISRLSSSHRNHDPNVFSNKTVQLAIDYINNNYSGNLTLETVAKNTFVSPNQLSRLFNRYCGTTVTKYIIGKRITEAKKLLTKGHSVTDTALMCGFNDYAHFIRAFKKAVGVPPGKYGADEN